MYVKKLIKQYSKSRYNYEITNKSDVNTINKNSQAWVFKHGLARGLVFEKYKMINTGLFSYLTYPYNDFNSEKITQLGSDLISWLFLFDDEHGEGRVHVGINEFINKSELIEKLETYRNLLKIKQLPKNPTPFQISLLDIVKRIELLNPDKNWDVRFSKAMGLYFDGCIDEYDYRRGLKKFDVKTYLNIRAKSIGAYPVFELISLFPSSNPYKNGQNFDKELLIKYLYHGALLCSWVNDLFSLDKEISEGETNNLVMVLKNEFNLKDYDIAMEKACDFNKTDLNQLTTIKSIFKFSNTLNPQLASYLNRIRIWTIGNLYWTLTTRRYKIKPEYREQILQTINEFNIPVQIKALIQVDPVL